MQSQTRQWLWWLTAGGSLWLRSGFPTRAIAAASFDDALFMRLAGSLGSGQWLGAYDKLTLVKGAFYPFFILTTFVAGIPFNLAEQALYVGACAIVAHLLGRAGGKWLGLLAFAALAFNPILLNVEMSRVIREAIYISLSLTLVALTVWVALAERPGPDRWHLRALASGFALGVVFAAYWLTREEGLWLLPALATVALVALPAWRRTPALAAGAAMSLLAASIAGGGLIGAVAAANQAYYGRFITSEFKAAEFERGYGALARIQPHSWRRYVVFPQDARRRAYAVSPAAAELKPVFDGPVGSSWRRIGCDQTAIADCPEILSGWFMWALRDAVAQAGHGKSAREAMEFYQLLADEINAACDRGAIACDPPRATLMPPFRWEYLHDTAVGAVKIVKMLIGMGQAGIGSAPSSGPRVMLSTFADTVGPISLLDTHVRYVEGAIAGTQASPELWVRGGGNRPSETIIDMQQPAGPPADPLARHFSVMTDCTGDCELIVGRAGQAEIAIPWARLLPDELISIERIPGGPAAGQNVQLFVVAATERDPGRAGAARRAVLLRIATVIAGFYAWATPVLCGLGGLGLLVSLAMRRALPPNPTLLALTGASLVAVLCRIALLAYLDVTSIPSANILYAAPASGFVILFALGGTILGGQALVLRRRG